MVQALSAGPRSVVELRQEAGSPPQTTARAYLRALTAAGVVERHNQEPFARGSSYELTASGSGLLEVAGSLAAWLARAPEGPIELGTNEAKSAVKALVESWSASLMRALAARPLSLTELDSIITCLSYPSLERRLAAMRLLGLVEALPAEGRGTPYTVSDWLRSSIAPLAAAARWEHVHQPEEAPPITNRDAEAAFLLALPLLRLPAEVSGSCRLAVRIGSSDVNRVVGVIVQVREGAIVDCVTRLEGKTDAWAVGSAAAWFAAVIERDVRGLELGGEPDLARELAEGLHETLFGAAPSKVSD